HTRCLSDWSSDVCSSDLSLIGQFPVLLPIFKFFLDSPISTIVLLIATLVWSSRLLPFFGQRETPHLNGPLLHRKHLIALNIYSRSEERRVGKECRFKSIG